MSVQWVWLFVMTMQTVWILRVVMSVCVELDTLELEATAQVQLKECYTYIMCTIIV